MEANKIPLNDLGGTGVFNLMAEELSSTPPTPKNAGREVDDSGTGSVTKVMRMMAEVEARDTFLVGRSLYTRYAPGLSSEAGRAITRSGFWSGAGFVGASIFASGLLLLINGGSTAGISPVLLLAGGALATFGWRRAWKAISDIDRPSPDAASPASAASTARGSNNDVDVPWLVPARTRPVSDCR
jgi:hypothetical protein